MKLEINAVGDISLGDHPVCVGHGARRALEKCGGDIFKDIEPFLKYSDINLCNIETVVSNVGLRRNSLSSFEMRGNPESIAVIKRAGFNVLGVANNHAMQHGKMAFDDMVQNLVRADVSVIGVDRSYGETAVHEFVHDNETVSAVFAVSIRPEEWVEERPVLYSLRESVEALLNEVRNIRSRYNGFVVCSIHWGLEFVDCPAPSQVELGRKLIDSGVDVVFGHHPHVLQPVERYKNGLIFYSLGNFFFDLWTDDTKLTAIAKVNLYQGQPPNFEIVPLKISSDFKLMRADALESEIINGMLSWDKYLERGDLPTTNSEYELMYDIERKKFRYSSYSYFLKNIAKMPVSFVIQSLFRTVHRRISGK